jgi:ABC-type lipoprotein release transport system permease subunit
MIFTLAWRNIWRNTRRTLITVSSILFAVLFASFMSALQEGAWDNMINNVVNYYYGYAQIHQQGFWDDQSIDHAFEYVDSVNQVVEKVDEVRAAVPRIESFALAAYGPSTTGVLVSGIDPPMENQMTKLRDKLVAGKYLEEDGSSVLVGKGVAERLKMGIGDTLVLISQGFRGVNAAGKYPVSGILNFPSPELNKQMVYMPLPEAQWFYGADGRVTTLALHLDDQKSTVQAVTSLQNKLREEDYEVMDWKELMPELLEAKALDSAGNVMVYIILYMIIAFGIFGTILMMVKERQFEFGILTSIGMHRRQLAGTVVLEILMLGILGSLAGILVSLPLVYYFHVNPIVLGGDYAVSMERFGFDPIFPTKWAVDIFLDQAIVVFVITLVLSIYPVVQILRLDPIKAMRES